MTPDPDRCRAKTQGEWRPYPCGNKGTQRINYQGRSVRVCGTHARQFNKWVEQYGQERAETKARAPLGLARPQRKLGANVPEDITVEQGQVKYSLDVQIPVARKKAIIAILTEIERTASGVDYDRVRALVEAHNNLVNA